MKPSSQITDRAKRYRANVVMEDWPKVCMFCGSTRDLGVDHLDGFEENGEEENLLWLCRSCNQLKSAVYKRAGLGRRTVQYNPGLFSRLFGPKETYRTTGGGHKDFQAKLKRERAESAARERAEERELRREELEAKREDRARAPKAVGRYKGFTIYKRRDNDDLVYYSTMDPDSWLSSLRETKSLIDTYKNPASGFPAWRDAVGVLRGEHAGSPFKAARVVRSTPVSRRYAYLDKMMRSNPGVPTFAQYAFAVSTHTRGEHDQGGAIIHATPKATRREYAERIADLKRGRGTDRRGGEVPF